MTRFGLLFAVAVHLALSVIGNVAHAVNPWRDDVPAWVTRCSYSADSKDPREALDRMACTQYAIGFLQAIGIANSIGGTKLLCPNGTLTAAQAVADFVAFAMTHPKASEKPLQVAFFMALATKYPCQK